MKPISNTTTRIACACALLSLGLAGAAHAAWPDKATPESLRTLLQSETARWDKVIKAAGVSADQ
ncbi:MAG: hypothetical protein JSS31_10335 [Proteobacteria bacterium]|nr:hypothetical protein [Pseudomonadota bacterium]MBS0494331.1 hypothetical protein [Pseudomonadota bacterium]